MPRLSKIRFVALQRREGWVMRRVTMLTAGIVATVALGTAAASATDYSRKLAQLAATRPSRGSPAG